MLPTFSIATCNSRTPTPSVFWTFVVASVALGHAFPTQIEDQRPLCNQVDADQGSLLQTTVIENLGVDMAQKLEAREEKELHKALFSHKSANDLMLQAAEAMTSAYHEVEQAEDNLEMQAVQQVKLKQVLSQAESQAMRIKSSATADSYRLLPTPTDSKRLVESLNIAEGTRDSLATLLGKEQETIAGLSSSMARVAQALGHVQAVESPRISQSLESVVSKLPEATQQMEASREASKQQMEAASAMRTAQIAQKDVQRALALMQAATSQEHAIWSDRTRSASFQQA